MDAAFFYPVRPDAAMAAVRLADGFAQPRFADVGAPPAAAGTAAAMLLRATLDHVQFGVLLLGARLTLLFANKAARRECERLRMLRIEDDRLLLPPQRHRLDGFLRALSDARQGRWSMVHMAHGEERLTLSVLPLAPQQPGPDAPALVMFGLRGHGRTLALEFYARSFDLTPAETRVLHAVAQGLTARQIAQRHGVELSTVRTQLGSIRCRTGVRSITELVHTLGNLPPIMPAAFGAQ